MEKTVTGSRADLPARVAQATRQYWESPELSGEMAEAHHALALELRDSVGTDPQRLDAVEDASGSDVLGWLLGLPSELARHGLLDEAVALGARWAGVTEAENFLGDRAVILAEAGRREEAIGQFQDNLIRWPTDPWILIKGGDVHASLGDKSTAAALYRHGLEYSGDDRHTRLGALERLLPLLDELGRSHEADALEAAEAQRDKAERIAAQAGLGDVPFVRPAPKVGRNEPCPCGSGKKHKKCCLPSLAARRGEERGHWESSP